MKNYQVAKSPERVAVETVLQESKEPLSARQIIDLTGEDGNKVHRCLSAIVKANQAHTVCGRRNASTYAWGPIPIVERETYSRIPTERYYGEPAIPLRAGCMDAFALGSVQNGELVPHTPPASIASKVSSRVYF